MCKTRNKKLSTCRACIWVSPETKFKKKMSVFLSADNSGDLVLLPESVAGSSKTVQALLRNVGKTSKPPTIAVPNVSVGALRLLVKDNEIAEADRAMLMEVAEAADFLEISDIMNAAAKTIARHVMEKGVAWLNLEDHMTTEEKAMVEKELAWLKSDE